MLTALRSSGSRFVGSKAFRPLMVGAVAAGFVVASGAPAMASETDHKAVYIGIYVAGVGYVQNHNTAVACDLVADGHGIRTEYTYVDGGGVIDTGSVSDGNGASSGCGSGRAPGGATMRAFRVCTDSTNCTSWFSA